MLNLGITISIEKFHIDLKLFHTMAEANKLSLEAAAVLKGYLFPPFTTTEWLEQAKTIFKPRDSDVFINSIAKSGTHWLAYTVYLLFYKEKITKNFHPTYANFFDMPQVDAIPESIEELDLGNIKILKSFIEDLPNPRIFMGHFPIEYMPQNQKAKYLYIYRNPKDIVISGYHHFSNMIYKPFLGTFEQYFEIFIETDLFQFCKHFKGFLKHKDDPNYFILSYEEFRRDIKTKVKEIATFLGIELTADLYGLIEKETNFETMKVNPFINFDHDMKKGVSFFPSGLVGTWKKTLSEEQSRKIDQILLSGLGEEMVKNYLIFSHEAD